MKQVVGGAVAVAATVAMIGAGGAGAAASAPHAAKAGSTLPTIKVTASGKHKFNVSGPTTFTAGRIAVVLKSIKKEHEVEVLSFDKGYTFKKFDKDFIAFFSQEGKGPNGSTPKSALKHLNNAIDHTNFYGGLDSVGGQTQTGTVVLPKAGKYYVVNDTDVPTPAKKLTVTAPLGTRAAPASSATVKTVTARRFKGAKTLPANGTITINNVSTESPHFLVLQHVKKGTTKKEVEQGLQSNSPPAFARKGQAATDVLGEGMTQTLSYKLPKGTYAELCFFPDPKTGMPHAFMGMIRIVTLK